MTVADRKKKSGSFYLPDLANEEVTNGLKAFELEGGHFWTKLKQNALHLFSSVLEDSDRQFELYSHESDVSSENESTDSE